MKIARGLVTLSTWTLGAAAAALVLRLLIWALRWLDRGYGAPQVIALEAIRLSFPIAAAVLVARWVHARATPVRLPRSLLIFGAWVGGAMAGAIAFHLLVAFLRWLDQPFGVPRLLAESILIAVAVASALLLAPSAQTHSTPVLGWLQARSRVRLIAHAVVLGLYFVTWGFGVPAVMTNLVRRDLDAYKDAYAGKAPTYWEHYPHLRASFGAPLLPGVVLVYYESQLGGQWGAGGWHVVAWWGFGTRELSFHWRWLS